MAEINLPDMALLWASAGDVLQPSDSKIQQGWSPEVPPRQWFNWLDNRQDQAIAHIAQHGIAVWHPTPEYQAGKSYVQGSDGIIYKALTTNTNINPVGGAPGNWESAFVTASTATQVASAAQARAMTANNVYISPLQLSNAFTGTNQSVAASGFQKLPGGLIIQWGIASVSGSSTALMDYPIPFPNTCFQMTGAHDSATDSAATQFTYGFTLVSPSQFRLGARRSDGLTTSIGVRWIAIGN